MVSAHLRWILLVSLVVLGGPAAHAATIVVSPGPGTPVQDAIDAALPGDAIRLEGGGYPESIVVDKALTIVGPSGTVNDNDPPAAVIAAGCAPGTTGITVAADNVRLRDLRVITYTEYGIDVQGRDKFRLQNVMVVPNCPEDAPTASLNLVATTRTAIDRGVINGFDVPGTAIRIAQIAERGNVRLSRTLAAGHDRGVVIENAGPGSVRVLRCSVNFNVGTGILLLNSDGVDLKSNVVVNNSSSGILIAANSDENRILKNTISGSILDVSDDGTNNCWKKNTYATGTVPSCP